MKAIQNHILESGNMSGIENSSRKLPKSVFNPQTAQNFSIKGVILRRKVGFLGW